MRRLLQLLVLSVLVTKLRQASGMAFHDSSAMHLEPSAVLQVLPSRVDRCFVVTVIKIQHSASPNVNEGLLAVVQASAHAR